MPSFLKDLTLRRRSKASIKPSDQEVSSENSSSNDGSNDKSSNGRNKSSSTLSSLFDKASPPTTLSSQHSRSNSQLHTSTLKSTIPSPPPIPPNRPRLPSAQGKRYSLIGMSMQDGDPNFRPAPTTSPYAPRVLSVSDGSWVHQKVLLVFGTCADPQQPIDGTISVYHHQDAFPPQHWPVNDSHFKALIYLQPGPNRLRLDFTSPRLQPPGGSSAHTSWISINFLPLISAPPLQLCILVGRDSPETYDAVPERINKEGNNLELAVRKFRMAAYLWQAFTAEHLNRNGFGRRCYRYEEEWQPGTLSYKDLESGQMRNEAKVHVIRLDKSVAEIQDLERAQQHEGASKANELYDFAYDAVRDRFKPKSGQPQYVSCMFLDSHWDNNIGTLRGHAALGGGDDTIKLAIFGSHCLQSYPAHLEEVVPAFSDCTRTDTNFVVNDNGEGGSSWEAANIGIGAHLHETGHLLGCPHQESGIMLRDFNTFNRTFVTKEPYSTRTQQPGQRLILPDQEASWHRLDNLRFRYHPCFQLPTDTPTNPDGTIQVWGVDNGTVLVTASTGIAWLELYPEGDDVCHHWIEYSDHAPSGPGAPKQITLTEQSLRERLPEDKRKRKLKIWLYSCGGGTNEVQDFSQLSGGDSRIKLDDGRPAFRSSKLGASGMDGSQPCEVTLGATWRQKELLRSVVIHHGSGIDGLEFIYESGRSDVFGHRGGSPDEFALDIRRGEVIIGFYVRAGFWIDGIQILTSTGRRSDFYGNMGGEAYTLIPPRGYSIAGIYGSCGGWIDGFGLIITR